MPSRILFSIKVTILEKYHLTLVTQKQFDNKPTGAVLFRTFSRNLKNDLYYYISITY